MSVAISFHLNKSKRYQEAKELVIIGRLNYSFRDASGIQQRHFKFTTGCVAPVKRFKKGRVDSTLADASHINSKLSEFIKTAKLLYAQFETAKQFPTPEAFKNKLLNKVVQVEEERNFVTDFETFITYHENKGSAITSIRGLRGTLKRLKEFATASKYALDYSTINLTFYGKFLAFCKKVELPGEVTGLKKNTIGRHIKTIKTFLNYAKANGWNRYEFYKSADFKILSEKIPVVALNEDEVAELAQHKLNDRPRLQFARDYFILGCETGLRYSDYTKINKRAIKEVKNGYNLEIKTQKTGAEVVIPLSQLAMNILSRYGYELELPPSNQKLNKNLKAITELAGIDKNITTHSARRTFATIQYNTGTPVQWIMKITGHKTESEFYKYIGVNLSENAEMVREMHDKYKVEKRELTERKLKVV